MATYNTGGKGHRVLSRLAHGPATMPELRAATGARGPVARKAWHLVGSLIRDELVVRDGPLYRITPDGAEALETLSAGQDFTFATPTARVFARAA